MKKPLFTPEELEEMAAADAEIDASPVTQAERDESRRRDYMSKIAETQRAYYEANREKIAETKRAYYEANREKIAETQRAYREANREKIAETKRAYYEANREKIAEIGAALRRWRKAHGMTQKEMGAELGICKQAVSLWELGFVPIDFLRVERKCRPLLDFFIEEGAIPF